MALTKTLNGNGSKHSNGNSAKLSNSPRLFKLLTAQKRDADRSAAAKCTIYLLLALAFFAWLLFDTWVGKHTLAQLLGYELAALQNANFRVVAFTIIAGGLGGAIDGIRSILHYTETFNRKHLWKYVSVPWMGCTLGLFVYALLRSSMAVLGGNVSSDGVGSAQVMANFAVGALAGFGSKDVFIWLDDKVHKVFQVTEKVPDVKGKPKEAAASRIEAAQLEVGEVSQVQSRNGKPAGTVMGQSPPAGAPIDRGQSVDIAVAANGQAH